MVTVYSRFRSTQIPTPKKQQVKDEASCRHITAAESLIRELLKRREFWIAFYVFFAIENPKQKFENTKWKLVNSDVLMFRFLCIQFTHSQIMYFDKFFKNFGDVGVSQAKAMTTSSHSRNLSPDYNSHYSHYLSSSRTKLKH